MPGTGDRYKGSDDEDELFVIDKDNRFQVSDTSRFPYCTMVEVIAHFKDGNGNRKILHGSGVLVGKRTVLTVAHNLCDQTYGWATSVEVIPGGSAGTSATYASSNFTTSDEWANSFNGSYDYGFISLNHSPGVGYLDTKVLTNSELLSEACCAYGYPDDKKSDNKRTLWYTAGMEVEGAMTYTFTFRGWSITGMSGGPVVSSSDTNTVLGIVVGDTRLNERRAVAALRITDAIQKKIQAYNNR